MSLLLKTVGTRNQSCRLENDPERGNVHERHAESVTRQRRFLIVVQSASFKNSVDHDIRCYVQCAVISLPALQSKHSCP